MSYSYRIHQNPLVFVKPAGTHPGRAMCRHCRRRIPGPEPRIGWHGHYYHISCWYNENRGREFLMSLLSVLDDAMLEGVGLRVEHDEPEEPAPQTGSFNLNDFGVRMTVETDHLTRGETYRVVSFTDASSRNITRASGPEDIGGARIIQDNGSPIWLTTRYFEVVLLDSAPDPAEPEPAEPVDDRLISHTGEEVVEEDLVRFIRNATGYSGKESYLGQEFRVESVRSSVSRSGRQLITLRDTRGITFYDDELMLVGGRDRSTGPDLGSEWVDIGHASELSDGDTVRIKPHAISLGTLGPGSITTVARVDMGAAALRANAEGVTWLYVFEDLEVQR